MTHNSRSFDFASRVLNGGAVLDAREGEGGAAGLAGGVGDGSARGVVVVAELLVAEAGGAAAVAVGEDLTEL